MFYNASHLIPIKGSWEKNLQKFMILIQLESCQFFGSEKYTYTVLITYTSLTENFNYISDGHSGCRSDAQT